MSYGNYGGGRGRGGNGRPKFQPKPRPVLPPEHACSPLVEAAIAEKSVLRDYASRGAKPSADTIVFNNDSSRTSLTIPVASLMALNQCGIPYNHPAFPPVRKFDTHYDANHYHIVYNGPIAWMHDDTFVHIPCYTRYVVDRHMRVLNAYNGLPVAKDDWGNFKLVPDGVSNSLMSVRTETILALAFLPLPEDFIDYGFGTYSHVFGVDPETRQCGWIKRPEVAVKDPNGQVGRFPTLPHYIKCVVNDFEAMKELNTYVRKGMTGPVTTSAGYMVKEVRAGEAPKALPVIDVPKAPSFDDFADPAPARQTQSLSDSPAADTTMAMPAAATDNSFDEDIPW